MWLSNKTIVIISPDSWSFLPASKHHYALELAKHNKVYFINPPNTETDFVDKGVTVINQYKKIRGIHFLPKVIRKFFMKLEVNSITSKVNNTIDVVWSFDTSRLYYLDLFKFTLKIAHIVDYTEHFYFKELISSADFCLSVADCISDKMLPFNTRILKLNHGYYENYSYNENITLPPNTGIYFGNLNMIYIDWKSIYKLVSHNKSLNFWFYGPLNTEKLYANTEFQLVRNCSNVKFHDSIAPELINRYLISADFCFLSYRHKEFGRQLDNSHKLMQYLGSGTPIFSSYTYEYKDSNLFTMYYDENDILEEFESFITNKNEDFSEEARSKRINFALNNTYSKQVERINDLILQRLNHAE